MTRGKFVLITKDEKENIHFHISTEFNGGMYPYDEGYGVQILEDYSADNINTLEEWKQYVERFNKEHHDYDEPIIDEITEINRQKCICNWNCSSCSKRDCCYINSDFEGVTDIFDITSWKYHSDYSYWLNLTDDTIEVKVESNYTDGYEVVEIDEYGRAVFNYKRFYETEETKNESRIIDYECSYNYEDDEDIIVSNLVEKYKNYNLTYEESYEFWKYDLYKNEINNIYYDYEELGKEYLFEIGIPTYLENYIDYASYGEDLIDGDEYYHELNSSGRIVYFAPV